VVFLQTRLAKGIRTIVKTINVCTIYPLVLLIKVSLSYVLMNTGPIYPTLNVICYIHRLSTTFSGTAHKKFDVGGIYIVVSHCE